MMPTKISETDKLQIKGLIDEAISLRDKGDSKGATRILIEVTKDYPDYASSFGLLGEIYWNQAKLKDAIECFMKAVSLSPKSELASLGLFHTLFEAGFRDEAFSEMKRFLSVSRSGEYNRLLHDIGEGLKEAEDAETNSDKTSARSVRSSKPVAPKRKPS